MVLKVHNLSLPLKWTPTGPLLSIEDKSLESIAWIVNPAVTGRIPQFALQVTCGEDIFMQPRYAVRPTKDEELSEAQARWHELSGEELGEDVYILGTTFTRQVVLPRQTLLSIYQTLEKLRAEFPDPPFPWLFRVDSYHLTPTDGEEELIGKLEERAVRAKASLMAFNDSFTELVRDLQEAGLFSEIYSEEKQYWLELWGFTTLLDYHRAALAFLNHFRQKLPTVPLTQGSEQAAKETNGAKPSFALEASINTRIPRSSGQVLA